MRQSSLARGICKKCVSQKSPNGLQTIIFGLHSV